MLPKQTVSVFYGATNQDTSAKGIKLGDLILAENVRQVKGGEWSKRDGFTQVAQSYEGQAGGLTPDSVVSPDGVQVLVRDVATDHVFARGSSVSSNQDKGHAARFVPKLETRFPAMGSDKQLAPMAKQCGSYVAYLEDSGHFRIVELNASETVASGSPTHTADTIVRKSSSISVAAGGTSTVVRSFALVDFPAFDNDNLWLLWIDQTNKIFSLKVPHANLDGGTFHTVYTSSESTNHKKFFTSITASCLEGGILAVAACGVEIDTTANYLSPGVGGTPATGFRTAGSGQSNYGRTFGVHGHLSKTTAEFSRSSEILQPFGRQVAAACTMASSVGFQNSNDYWFYVFYGVTTKASLITGEYLPGVCAVKVAVADCSFVMYEYALTAAAPDAYGKPSDWNETRWSMFGWFYNAQLAAKETPTGIDVAVTVIPYYVTGAGVFRAWNPDYLATQFVRLSFSSGEWSTVWVKLGSCVAQGCIRQRDHSQVLPVEGVNYLLTVWEDKEALQTCYHVREWETGEIVGQVAYGRAAHVGHTGTRDAQAQAYISDVQQPMLNSWNVSAELPGNIIIGLQSENQNNSVDVAELVFIDWDYNANAKPTWQNAFAVMGMAFAPGPIPTVYNGFQQLREAGPLVYPSRPEVFEGTHGS